MEFGLTPDSQWDAGVPEVLDAARLAGFDAVGLRSDRGDRHAAAAYATAGLRCHELLVLRLSDSESETVAAAEELASLASVIGAEWVLTVFRGEVTTRTPRLVNRCASLFAEAGAAMAVEFSPFGPVTSIEAGLRVVAAAEAGEAGLMIDTWHFEFGDSTWRDLEHVPIDKIAYVQFSDALTPRSSDLMMETTNRRTMPGQGFLELGRFASTLLDRGWSGLVSVEVLSEQLRTMPVADFARLAYETTTPFWS